MAGIGAETFHGSTSLVDRGRRAATTFVHTQQPRKSELASVPILAEPLPDNLFLTFYVEKIIRDLEGQAQAPTVLGHGAAPPVVRPGEDRAQHQRDFDQSAGLSPMNTLQQLRRMSPLFGQYIVHLPADQPARTGGFRQQGTTFPRLLFRRSMLGQHLEGKCQKRITRQNRRRLIELTMTTRPPPPEVVIVKNNFRNVPEQAVSDWHLLTPGATAPEQYFFKA